MKRPPIDSRIDIKVESAVNPSEDSDKVIGAITQVIGRCSPEFRYVSRVIGRSSSIEALDTIYEQVRSRSAMGVLRRLLIDNRLGDTTWFLLNKQAAAAGIAVVIEDDQESPLGPIRVTIDCEQLDLLTDWLVPDPYEEKGGTQRHLGRHGGAAAATAADDEDVIDTDDDDEDEVE